MSFFENLIKKRIGYKKPIDYNLNQINLEIEALLKSDEVDYFSSTPIDNSRDGSIVGIKDSHSNPKEQQWSSKKLHEKAQGAYQDLKQILSS